MSAKSSVLYAGAKEIGSICSVQNERFLACKAADEDPHTCLSEGKDVMECALSVLKSAMDTCADSFQKHANCLDKQISQEYMFERCRKTENAFMQCRNEYREAPAPVSTVPVASSAKENARESTPSVAK